MQDVLCSAGYKMGKKVCEVAGLQFAPTYLYMYESLNEQFDVRELLGFLRFSTCLKFSFGPKCDVRNCSKFGLVVM